MKSNELQNLRKSLPKGYRNALSQETGYSKKHIDHVLRGTRINQKILNAAIGLAEKNLQEILDRKARVNNIMADINTVC